MTEVVAALIFQGGKVLACRRPAHKKRGLLWEFPGGKREKGESLTDTLKRECKEELGVEIAVKELFAETVHAYDDIEVHLYFYTAEIVRGELTMLEHCEMRFAGAEELSALEFCPADKDIVEKMISFLRER